ncbi:MAG: choice-of-anchor B family protein [Bacteroidia bacterium]
MKKIVVALSLMLGVGGVFSQNYNLEEVGYLNLTSIHSTGGSDIWGWVDSEGNEYAIVGLNNGTSIVDVTDPANPIEVFFEPGMNSLWRDIKTWNNHAYVTTEAKQGLLIIDLSTLPSNPNLITTLWNPTTPTTDGNDLSAHNLYIDENGFCYLFGANIGDKGAFILDLNSDPKNPTEAGIINGDYVHDGVAKNNTLFTANIGVGVIAMWNVSDKSNPILLGVKDTPNKKSHNIWFSDDLNYVYTTDEVSGAFLTEYDVTDPTDITETDRIRTTTGTDVIPHNTHFINDFIVTSYYRDGVIVHDVSDKGNMVEVARYDTSPAFSGSGFNGCWGVYPWLPSCNIIASDMENGLYILQPDASLNVCGTLDTNKHLKNPYSIYPNPATDEIRIGGAVNANHTLSVYNILGELVLEKDLSYYKINIPSSLEEGIYLVKVSDGDKIVLTSKLLKK